MSGGHVAMAFDQSFLLALLLLVVGSGLLKGNISAQVGGLYRRTKTRVARAGSPSSARQSISARSWGHWSAASSAQRYGWHVGFGDRRLAHAGRACDLPFGLSPPVRRKWNGRSSRLRR